MKRAVAVGMLAVTFFATLLAACGKVGNDSEALSGPLTIEQRRVLKIPDDATHCRLGHARVIPPGGGPVGTLPIRWYVKEGDAAEFAPRHPGYEFEIVKAYSSMPPPPAPPFVIDPEDGFVNTVNGNTIKVDYTNKAGQAGQTNFEAILNMYKFDITRPKPLWAQGAAPLGTMGSSGTIAMFLRPDTEKCEHSYYPSTPPTRCQRVLIEYFDYADAASVRDLPQAWGPGQNIFPIDHPSCRGGERETSDGDGHEGPP